MPDSMVRRSSSFLDLGEADADAGKSSFLRYWYIIFVLTVERVNNCVKSELLCSVL
jgi:hypothetical protein